MAQNPKVERGASKGGMCMNVTEMRLADIVPYERNVKKHDQKQINNVAESIRQYGFVQPIVVDADGVIVIGHCRALAAKKLGMEKVPCVCVDDLTPEQVKALRLVDNKSNESEWDTDLLGAELESLDLLNFDFDWDGSSISYIDLLEDGGFEPTGKSARDDFFQMTFLLPRENEIEVANLIKEKGKSHVVEIILKEAKTNAEVR